MKSRNWLTSCLLFFVGGISLMSRTVKLIVLALIVFSSLGSAQGPPSGKTGIRVAPDTVYLDKVGSETILSRTVSVMRVGPPGAALTFTVSVSTSSGGAWLAASPLSGMAPSDLTITATPGMLGAGTYNGKVTVTP